MNPNNIRIRIRSQKHYSLTSDCNWLCVRNCKIGLKAYFLKRTFGGIFQSDFVTSICICMFKIARNQPKNYHLCQKPAKSGSARIWRTSLQPRSELWETAHKLEALKRALPYHI